MKVDQELVHSKTHGCLGGAVVKRWTRDRKVAGSTSQLGQLSLPSLQGK